MSQNTTRHTSAPAPAAETGQQLLHLVLGGELRNLNSTEFKDLSAIEVVGFYPNYASAHSAWKAAAQRSVDNAHMRYFVVHLHRLLDPGQPGAKA